MASSENIVIAFDLYGTLLSTESIAKELATHFGNEKAGTIAALWRRYQLEYTWRLDSMCLSLSSITSHRITSRLPPKKEERKKERKQKLTPTPSNLQVLFRSNQSSITTCPLRLRLHPLRARRHRKTNARLRLPLHLPRRRARSPDPAIRHKPLSLCLLQRHRSHGFEFRQLLPLTLAPFPHLQVPHHRRCHGASSVQARSESLPALGPIGR